MVIMKWKKPLFRYGDTRIREEFLFFPKTIEQGKQFETRWLEHARWMEKFEAKYVGDMCSIKWHCIMWID